MNHLSRFEDLAAAGELEAAVLELIEVYDNVSFVELNRYLEPFTEVRGEYGIRIASNLTVWECMSADLADLVRRLWSEGRIHFHPCSSFSYMLDGGGLTLPVAKRPPKNGYRSLRWLPVVMRLKPTL